MTSSDWILAGTQIVQVVITGGLVYFAAVTINEARKDRKKATIERMLEKIYFPMREILTRARSENTGVRGVVRQQSVAGSRHGLDYVVAPEGVRPGPANH